MSPEEARAIWNAAKANGARLDACPGPHVFLDLTPEKRVGKKWRCSGCGGEVDGVARAWYQAGLAHGRQTPPR
jgi:hypothetical protein